MTDIVSLSALVARFKPGQKVAVPVDRAGAAIAATIGLINAGLKDIHLVCAPTSGLQADLLIGAGVVATLETSAISLGEIGGAPRFMSAVKEGALHMLDATCPAIYAGLLAAQKGVSFMPVAGIIGSDLLKVRADWKTIPDPFVPDQKVVLIPAISPDITLFHASEADRFGNVWIGRNKEIASLVYASRSAVATVERIVDHNLLDDERRASGVLPSIYVEAIAVAERGAWPLALDGEYAADEAIVRHYASLAQTPEGFEMFVRDFHAPATQAA